jgi:acyl carrier protein
MLINELDESLSELICEVLEYTGEVKLGMIRADFDKWDSLKQVLLVDALESKYDIQFSIDEMMEIQGVDDIVKVLIRHRV